MKKILEAVEWIKKKGLYPEPPLVLSPHAAEVIVNNKKVLMFATNNYLGMMTDPRVKEAAIEGVKKWGIGNGSARLLTGNLEIHHQLESAIAEFKHRPAALTFVSGYGANEGTIPAIVNVLEPSLAVVVGKMFKLHSETIVFSDEYNHASIITGIKLSGAKKEIYKHRDVNDLKERLTKYSLGTRKIIITDGVFSMDGDIAPLPDILDLAEKYHASVYLDDAHATGILGKHGRGVEDYFNVEGKSDVVMGTFTKAFGGVGGFIVSHHHVIDYIRVTANSFIFTAPIAPPVVYGLIESIKIVASESWRREKLLANADYMRDKLTALNFDLCGSSTQIIPILIGKEEKAIQASKMLLERGICAPAARWPAVPEGKARLRLTTTCEHTTEQIDYLIEQLREVRLTLQF